MKNKKTKIGLTLLIPVGILASVYAAYHPQSTAMMIVFVVGGAMALISLAALMTVIAIEHDAKIVRYSGYSGPMYMTTTNKSSDDDDNAVRCLNIITSCL